MKKIIFILFVASNNLFSQNDYSQNDSIEIFRTSPITPYFYKQDSIINKVDNWRSLIENIRFLNDTNIILSKYYILEFFNPLSKKNLNKGCTFILNNKKVITVLDSLNNLILLNKNGYYGLKWIYNLPLYNDTSSFVFSSLEPNSCIQIFTRILINKNVEDYKRFQYTCFGSSKLKNSSQTIIESAGYRLNYQNYIFQKIISNNLLFIVYSMHRVKNYGWPRFQIIKFYDENEKFDRINDINEIKRILKGNNQERLIKDLKIK